MATSLSWRAAHAWLSGYSDALAKRPNDPGENWSNYAEDYARGYASGERKLAGPVVLSANEYAENLGTSLSELAGVQEAIEAGELPEIP